MNKKIIPYIVILLLMVVGFMIRAKGTLLGYFAFTYDPARDMLAIHDLVYNHKVSLIGPTTGLPGVFYGPWWYWILTPAFIISGGDPKALILWISFLSVLMIPIGYYIGNKISGVMAGIFAACVFAFSQIFISYSVQLWNPNLVPFFTLLTFFLFYKILFEKKKYFFLLGLSVGAVFEFQMAFGMFFVLGIVIGLSVLAIKKYISWKRREFGKIFIGFFLFLSPRILFDIRHDFLMSRSYAENIFHPKVYQLPMDLFHRFLNRLEVFFTSFKKTLSNEQSILGVFVLVSIIFMLLMVFRSASRRTKTYAFILLGVITTLYIGFSLYPDALWEYYVIGLSVLYVLSIAIGLSVFKKRKWVQLAIAAAFILFSGNIRGLFHTPEDNWEGDASVYINQKRVVDTIYHKEKGKPFDVVVYTPALIDYQYQYLFAWLGRQTYKYMPTKESKTVYYIIEHKDGEDAERDWLIARKSDGKILSRTLMPGSIYLEERSRENK